MIFKRKIISATVLITCLMVTFSCTKEDDAMSPNEVEKWSYFDITNGLPSNQINCLAEDGYHNIWIGTNKGLVKYDGSGFTYYSRKTGLPSDSIYSLYWDRNSELIVGTQNGFGEINSKNQYSDILRMRNLQCIKLNEDNKDDCVYCATNLGVILYYYITEEWGYVMIDSTLRNGIYLADPVYDIAIDKNNYTWISAKKGIYVYTASKVEFYTKTDLGFLEAYKDRDDGPLLSNILRLFTDKTGNLWITPSCGTNSKYFTGSKFINDSIFFGLNNYKSIIQDQYNNYWISIANKGVLNHGGGMTKVYNATNSKLISNDVNVLLYDSKNNLWLGSNDDGLMYYQNINPLQYEFGGDHNSTPSVNPIY